MDPGSVPKKLLEAATGKFDEVVRSPQTAKRLAEIERRISERRRERKLEDGTFRGVRVVVHHGWVTEGDARVHVRVVEEPRLPAAASKIPYWDVTHANLRRHAVLSFPGVRVRARIGAAVAEDTTDDHGFAALNVPVGYLSTGWHPVRVETLPSRDTDRVFAATGHVLRPDPDAAFHVVSDIDDTVIRTGLDEGLSALRRTLFGDAHTRRAVPGMSSLYRGLARGRHGLAAAPPEPGFFYVSTGSWSFYEMLTQFLQLRGFPRGPLFLTDWGPSDRYVYRSGRQHKQQAIDRLMTGYPDTPLLLIGDSGQHDPEIYVEAARQAPDKVVAIVIVRAPGKSDERVAQLRELAGSLRKEGITFVMADDASVAARELLSLELIDNLTVEDVDTEIGARF